MSKSRANALSKSGIRNYALRIRTLLGYKNCDYINAPALFDLLTILFAKQGLDFDYRIMPDDHEVFIEKEEAYTDISSGIIYIKESVMVKECQNGYTRETFTLIHELGHYLLHYLQSDARLSRVSDDTYVPPYCDPEWQADTFASEFLMPYDECIKMNAYEIQKKYHVSKKAAEVRYEKIRNELINKIINNQTFLKNES